MSNNLELGTLPEGVESPEALINGAFGAIDSLLTESFDIDLSAANAAPSAIDLRRASFISLLGAAQARDVVLPVAKRTLFLKNYGTAQVTLKCGTTSIAVPSGQARTVRLTGSVNGLEDIGGGGGSGGGDGGAVTDQLWDDLVLNLTDNDVTVTEEQIKGAIFVTVTTGSVVRLLTFPKVKTHFIMRVNGPSRVDLKIGDGVQRPFVTSGARLICRINGQDDGFSSGPPFTPGGGLSGQVFRKASNGNGDVEWGGYTVPDGGTTGQILAKASNNNGQTQWVDVPSGGGGDPGGGGVTLMPTQPPSTAMFDMLFDTAGVIDTVSSDSRVYSMGRTDTGNSDQSISFRGMAIPTPTNPWTADFIIRTPFQNPNSNLTHACGLLNNANQSIVFGHNFSGSTTNISAFKFNSSSFAATLKERAVRNCNFLMFRMKRTATHYQFFYSLDFGLTFDLFYEEAINAASYEAVKVGLFNNAYAGFTEINRLICPYFNFQQ